MQSDPHEFVLSVLARRTGLNREQIGLDSRLTQDLHLDGDDAIDTLLEISRKCSMDLSGFDSTSFFRSEPSLLSLLWFLPSQKRNRESEKRSITVRELIEAARQGRLYT